ncbi:MAG: single-stranded DNA-binding protein [Burkholderiaceae bacterium]|nr:single-stranded DNA-binding protein [Burkholderiaceae bacterium]
MRFAEPVAHVYNPLEYAWAAHEAFLRRFGGGRKKVLMLGMNPGPFGMMQTGVPFGEVAAVREWMGIDAPIGRPAIEHPKRPIDGFACTRSEVSGRRLWGWAAARFGSADAFFAQCIVLNYCPLVFLEASGRNRTPEQLPGGETEALYQACDGQLRSAIETTRPQWVIGIGAFAAKRLRRVLGDAAVPRIAQILHPSPASPAANRGWSEAVDRTLDELGVFASRGA